MYTLQEAYFMKKFIFQNDESLYNIFEGRKS